MSYSLDSSEMDPIHEKAPSKSSCHSGPDPLGDARGIGGSLEERLAFLEQSLDPDSGILDHMVGEEYLTLEEGQEIAGIEKDQGRSKALVSAVVGRGVKACIHFVKGLEELQPSLAESMQLQYGDDKTRVSSPMEDLLLIAADQESCKVRPDGTVLTSNIMPMAELTYPHGAVFKTVDVSLEVLPVPPDFVTRYGTDLLVGPIVTIVPRRRKFHKAIVLKIPMPASVTKKSLRVMCCISPPGVPVVLEDITDSCDVSIDREQVMLTTCVSAVFWPISCSESRIKDATLIANELYKEASTRFVLSVMLGCSRAMDFHKEAPPPSYEAACAVDTMSSSRVPPRTEHKETTEGKPTKEGKDEESCAIC